MANNQNLIPNNERSPSEVRENARKGGQASGRARRRKKDLAQALQMLLDKKYSDKNGNQITGTEAIATKLFEQAMKGNIRAFETLRDTVGQKPVEKVMVSEVDPAVVSEVERAVLGE